MKRIWIIICLLVAVLPDQAQRKAKTPTITPPSYADSVLTQYTDSLYRLRSYYDSCWSYKGNDLLNNPYYYRLFVQPTFYFTPVKQQMDLTWSSRHQENFLSSYRLSPPDDKTLQSDSALNDFFASVYVNQPNLVVTSQSVLDKENAIRTDLPSNPEHKVDLSTKVTAPKPIQVFEPIQVVGYKPNFWKFTQSYNLQLMQYYFSENWYKGGNNYNSFLFTTTITANYNNQSKISFNNTLSIQLGMQTVKNDTIHPWHTTTDEIRLVNQLSVKAAKNWSYTATLNSKTSMLPKYPNNSKKPTSDFMSPFQSVLSLGMKSSLTKTKFTMSINMAPLSFDLRYVGRKALYTRYGNLPNHKFREYYGSNVTIDYRWQMMKELLWTSRMYYFTNYKKVQFEWENTFKFTINKYRNAQLYLYPRFDDTEYDDNHKHTVQFKQWLSLGFGITL